MMKYHSTYIERLTDVELINCEYIGDKLIEFIYVTMKISTI